MTYDRLGVRNEQGRIVFTVDMAYWEAKGELMIQVISDRVYDRVRIESVFPDSRPSAWNSIAVHDEQPISVTCVIKTDDAPLSTWDIVTLVYDNQRLPDALEKALDEQVAHSRFAYLLDMEYRRHMAGGSS